MQKFSFVTGTATLVIFDPSNLKHRFRSKADWWSVPTAELEEVNLGNAIFVALGSDGEYQVTVETAPSASEGVSANLSCKSGVLFIGPGEMVTNDGLEPDTTVGGAFVSVAPKAYKVSIGKTGLRELRVVVEESEIGANAFSRPLSLVGLDA